MDLRIIFMIFLFSYVSTIKFHLIKRDAIILTINSVGNSIEGVTGDTVGLMFYENNINKTGWANLELITFDGFEDEIQSFFGGYLEGYITGDLISMNYQNNIEGLCLKKKTFCELLKVFVDKNRKFTEKMIKENKNSDYWHQLDLIYKQIEGLEAGYQMWKIHNNQTLNTTESSYFSEIFLLNIGSELGNLERIIMQGTSVHDSNHCSAIVKPLSDGSDLFVAHNTWSDYDSMLRIMKKYKFAFNSVHSNKSDRISGHSVSFSSYPGLIFSDDDYYVLSSGLVVQETTNVNYNLTLYKNIHSDNMVLEFARNLIANRLANSGKEWTVLFGEYNSGTYNNQFMIVDYKRFKRGTKVTELSDGLLWVIEQMPAIIRTEDVTHVLREQGYWASYNVPYFKDAFNITGNEAMSQKYGPYFSYEDTARAKIFRRDQSSVTDMKTLYGLMRYNDFKNDPLSLCKVYNQTCSPPYVADLAIASRNDLNEPNGKYPLHDWTHRGEGAIDAKMTNSSLVWNLEILAVSGPTDRQQKPFQWSKTDIRLKHRGQPDLFNFKPIYVKWYPNSYEIANNV